MKALGLWAFRAFRAHDAEFRRRSLANATQVKHWFRPKGLGSGFRLLGIWKMA